MIVRNVVDTSAFSSFSAPPSEMMPVYSFNEALPVGRWTEVAFGDCPLGCKVYLNSETGQRVLSHNSNYGCKR